MPERTVPSPDVSRRRLLGGALTAVALPLLGTACGRAGTASRGDGLTVTDLTGKSVELPHPARRVVTIPLPAASMVVAVNGGPEVLVGMNAASRTAVAGSFLGSAYPELLKVPTDVAGAEFAPNVESVLNLSPDVVIQWGDRGPGIVEPLRQAGLTVARLTYGTQKDLEGAIALYGALLGKRKRAERMVAGMRERMRKLRSELRTPGAGARSAPSVLYLRGATESLQVGGGASYNHYVTELVGARNPAAGIDSEQAAIDTEQLLKWDPDIVLLGNFGPAAPKDLYGDPALASLRAVRERRIYKVPLGGYRWDPPSQESPLMWQWLAGLVHGTGAPGLRAEVVRQYAFLYGAEPTDAQLDGILRTKANSGSRDYDDFGR
ncbi:ABC transporter substrate-binding protein [Streptomyces sp. NPDC002851]